jgi:hypothetical protein
MTRTHTLIVGPHDLDRAAVNVSERRQFLDPRVMAFFPCGPRKSLKLADQAIDRL